MDEYGPCPICGGAAVESDYDRSAGQASCGGECGWAFPADAWRRLSDAAALAAAVGRLGGRAFQVRPRAGHGYHAYTDEHETWGETPATALVALAGEVGG